MDQPHKQAQIEQLFDHVNRRAIDRLDGLLHPAYVGHSQRGEIRGIPAFTEFVQTCWLNPFPDARFVVSNIVIDGDLASWQIRFIGTNSVGVAPACLAGLPSAQTGLLRWSLMGMPPTGASIDVTSLHLARLDRGRLIEHWMVNDQLAVLPESPLGERSASAPS